MILLVSTANVTGRLVVSRMLIKLANSQARRTFVGGSDARIIMGNDEEALLRLWREKRGEAEPEDLSGKSYCPAWGRDRGPQSTLV